MVRVIPLEGKQAHGRGLSCPGLWSQIQIWSRLKRWKEPQRGAAPLLGQLRIPKPAAAAGKGNSPSLPRSRHNPGHRARASWQPFTRMGLGNATGSGHLDATPDLPGSLMPGIEQRRFSSFPAADRKELCLLTSWSSLRDGAFG